MIAPGNWTSRVWTFGREPGLFPAVLERLRGTPARAEELVRTFARESLVSRENGKWSAQEHIGHLADLHPLDEVRLAEFLDRVEILTAADMTNAATQHARHDLRASGDVLAELRRGRERLVERLGRLTSVEAGFAAIHPRLQQRMTIVDWMFFVAEHDDHHLAYARLCASK